MSSWNWLWLALLAVHVPAALCSTATATHAPAVTHLTHLFLRDGTCPANTFQCSQQLGAAFGDICCQTGQTCALDANNNPACCPSGAVCTGTAPATVATGTPAAGASYVSNAYFSFPYAATTYDDQGACQSAVSACSKNYDACVTVLESGGGYGVTIAVPGGGGTTVSGNAQGAGASATPICSSLSSQACSDLKATPCSEYKKSAAALATKANLLLAAVGISTVVMSAFI
ncbi:hypothetical protein G7046_g4581 [Stylonectria norvegica]|nr:hypothetical protein G7046_g4581 [Stylonectria norvegica]